MEFFDMSGLTFTERRKLLEWYLREAPILETKAKYEVLRLLKRLGEEDKEFVVQSLRLLFAFEVEGEGEEDVDVELLPKDKREVKGYV